MTTLVSDIITRAYRETNIIASGGTPTTNEVNEALPLLNTLVLSTVGNEVGDGFTDLNIGGDADQSDIANDMVPSGARLVFNLSAPADLFMDPSPYDGQRCAFVDAGHNMSLYPVVIDGNGRTVEGANSITLNTSGDARQWLYRADTANWVKITSLLSTDPIPFPPEFDDYFAIMLALRLNPRNGQVLSQESMASLKRMRSQINSRYANSKTISPDVPYRHLLSQSFLGFYGFSASDQFAVD